LEIANHPKPQDTSGTVQHSSGGKTKLGAISKKIRNQMLRSQLETGAFTFVNSLSRKEPKTEKERWLKSFIDRKGKNVHPLHWQIKR